MSMAAKVTYLVLEITIVSITLLRNNVIQSQKYICHLSLNHSFKIFIQKRWFM